MQVSLTGTATDDGLPSGSTVSRNWSVVSGPAAVSLSSANTATTAATFTALGSYVLRFTASDTELNSSDDVTVTIQPPAGAGSQSFSALHDAFLENGNNNNITQLRVEKSTARTRTSYLRFDLSSLTAIPRSALLRLTEGDDTSSGTMTLRLYAATSSTWTETAISSANAPAKGAQLAIFTGDVTDGMSIDFDVSALVTGAGNYSFILESDSSTKDVSFVSKENAIVATRPALIVSTSGNAPPSFSGYSKSTPVNSPLSIPYSLILATASDPDGDPVTLVTADDSSSAGGYVTMAADRLTYTPPIDYSGPDSFILTVQDGRGGFTSAALVLTVLPDDGITGKNPPVLEKLAASQMKILFHGTPGLTYAFQRSSDLISWTTIHSAAAGVDGSVQHTDSPPAGTRVFYRVSNP